MTTKTKLMKSVAKAVTKSLKAQGYAVPHNTVLNALAASDGNLNWHVLAAKKESKARADTPIRELCVGIHEHKGGFNYYLTRTQAEMDVISRGIAVQYFDQEFRFPEGSPESLWSDEQMDEYYWENIEDEWFTSQMERIEPTNHQLEIDRVLLCSSSHLTQRESRMLNASAYCRGEFAWMIPLAQIEDSALFEVIGGQPSEGLAGALAIAKREHCAYLLFDRDGKPLDGVPTYDW